MDPWFIVAIQAIVIAATLAGYALGHYHGSKSCR